MKTYKFGLLVIFGLLFGFSVHASGLCRHFLLEGRPILVLDPAALTNQILADIGHLNAGTSSVTVVHFPLADDSTSAIILAKMLRDARNHDQLANGFFSQFRITPEGLLVPIGDDPTVATDHGDEIASYWNHDPRARAAFQHIYQRAQELTHIVDAAIPETALEIGEVVFSYQVRRPSENWHLDWYKTEYLIGTQALVAKRLDEDGELYDEGLGGTEYLILDSSHEDQTHISFNVNESEVTTIEAKGVPYTAPTGLLALHSGTSRVESVMGPDQRFNLVAPAHRGTRTPLDFRGSIAIRFKPDSGK